MSQHSRQTSSTSIPHRTSNSVSSHTPVSANASRNTGAESHPASPSAASQKQTQGPPQAQSKSSASTTSQSRASRPDTHEVVRRIVAPGSVLFQHQPPPPVTRERLHQTSTSAVSKMERRHPSSFQQLEKLGEGTYATVCLGNKTHTRTPSRFMLRLMPCK